MNTENETCVVCQKELDIPVSTNIDMREHYVEGAGQLCKECYNSVYPRIYDNKPNQEVKTSQIEKL